METKANYVLVGAFTLVVIAIAFGYIFWAASQDDSAPQSVYGINFQCSVSGLSVTAPVLLNGVRVGQVTNIKLSPDDVSAVHVTISVTKGTPIKEDSVATLEAQGLTWLDAAGRTYTLSWGDLKEWQGERAQSGRVVPKGFPRSNRFGPAF